MSCPVSLTGFRIAHAGGWLITDISFIHKLLCHISCFVDRDRKPQTFYIGSGGFCNDDADQLPVAVKQAAARVSRVDGGIGLQKRHGLTVDGKFSVQCTDDAGAYRSAKFSKRISDGNRHIADCQLITVSISCRCQILGADF